MTSQSSTQTVGSEYVIRFVGFSTDEGVEGYNANDYLAGLTVDGGEVTTRYASREAAETALRAAYKGADSEGVDAIFEVEER